MSDSPFNKLTMGAVALHEMYQSLLEAGFNPEQAIELIKHTLTLTYAQSSQKPPPPPPNYPN